MVLVALGALLVVAAGAAWQWQHERAIERASRLAAAGDRGGDGAPPPVEAKREEKPKSNEATRAAAESAPAAARDETAAVEPEPPIRGIVVEPSGDRRSRGRPVRNPRPLTAPPFERWSRSWTARSSRITARRGVAPEESGSSSRL